MQQTSTDSQDDENRAAPIRKDLRMVDIQRAWSAMTWGNTTQTAQDWSRILLHGSPEERLHLFQHMFREDPTGEYLSSLLSMDDRRLLATSLTRPLPRAHLERRRRLYRAVDLGENQLLPELAWE